MARLTDSSVAYPEYYLKPFHAYSEGNLNWLAAFEAESATYSMALRVWPAEVKAGALGWRDAQARLRDSFTGALAAYAAEHKSAMLRPGAELLDVGCSVGISTRALCAAFPSAARVTGLDLSPFMLSVASLRDKADEAAQKGPKRAWVHGLAEATRLEAASVELYAASFLFHELPQAATAAVLAEAYRVLKPGGVFALTDNNPRSEVIQKLPPALFTLMKSTEPHSDVRADASLQLACVLTRALYSSCRSITSSTRRLRCGLLASTLSLPSRPTRATAPSWDSSAECHDSCVATARRLDAPAQRAARPIAPGARGGSEI
jgi:ubiquinone/menaquinone biosynthesis C-methylase UbiE